VHSNVKAGSIEVNFGYATLVQLQLSLFSFIMKVHLTLRIAHL